MLVGAGTPEMVAVPSDFAAKLMPGGSVPLSVIVGVGVPLAVTEKLEYTPGFTESVLELVKTGGVVVDTSTVSV